MKFSATDPYNIIIWLQIGQEIALFTHLGDFKYIALIKISLWRADLAWLWLHTHANLPHEIIIQLQIRQEIALFTSLGDFKYIALIKISGFTGLQLHTY